MSANGDMAYDPSIPHLLTVIYDGTKEGTKVRLDGADQSQGPVAHTGAMEMSGDDTGTGAFSTVLDFFADNTGDGEKAGKFAEARLYPLMSLDKVRTVEREMLAAYPYTLTAP